MSPGKEAILELGQSLPDDCTFEDIHYQLYVREKILQGRKAFEEGRYVPIEEVERRIATWGKSSGPTQP